MNWTVESGAKQGQVSWLHGWPAGLKLVMLLVLASTFVLVTNPWWLAIAALVLIGVWRSVVGSIDWQTWRHSLWVAVTMSVVVLYVIVFAGVSQGFVVMFRLLALLFAALAVMASTPISEMMRVIQQVLTPLGRRGWVNPEKVALTFGLCLRLIPVLLVQWQEIREAQIARGVTAAPHALLIPMLVRTIERAEELAQAIDARGNLD